MKDSVFTRVFAVLLCMVMLVGMVPVHTHAEEVLSQEEKNAVTNRSMGSWIFPVAEEFYDYIEDFSGCRGGNENALYESFNNDCTSGSHAASAFGNDGIDIRVTGGAEVFAPVEGWFFHSGNTAVIEQSQPNGYSYYLILTHVTGASVDSDSYVGAGDVIAYTDGSTLHFSAVMAPSGKGDQIAANPQWELEQITMYGWLTQPEGTGMICVNPSGYTYSQLYSYRFYTLSGPITYSFKQSAPAQTPTEPATEAPTEAHTEHEWDGGVITTQPTHFSSGVCTYTCKICGVTTTAEIPASAEHVYDQQVASDAYLVSPANCLNPAVYNYSCVCGERGLETFAYGQPTDHSWDGGVITTQPTHGTSGVRTYTCQFCGTTWTEEVAADAEHVFDQQVASDAYLVSHANCQSPAVYNYSCICGERGTATFVYGDTAQHEWDGGVITTQPTHTQPGVRTYTCKVCGTTWTEEVTADAGHVFDQQVVSDAYLASNATCQSPALYYYSCTCGEHGDQTFASGGKVDHSWDGGVAAVQPTHTADGKLVYTCKVCGTTYEEAIPADVNQHIFDQRVAAQQYLASPATCTSGAAYYYSCTCGAAGVETFVEGQPLGHTFASSYSASETHHWFAATCEHTGEVSGFGEHVWDEGKITVQPGHAANGEKTYTCTVCGAVRKETVIGESHVYDQEVAADKYLKAAATCTEPAVYYKSCVCGEMGTDTFISGEAKGHTFSKTWSHNAQHHWQAASCGHDVQQNVGDHIWDGGKITQQPTATSKGQRTFTCIVCGEARTETLEPTTHTHTFDTRWTGNDSYHWHPATCEHSNEKSDFGEHVWDGGVITVQPSHYSKGEKLYTCKICGGMKREAISESHVFDQQIATSAFLRTSATCTSAPTYYKSCVCGARSNDFFTAGYAVGHSFSGNWSKDETYHWHTCTVCGAKGDITSHYFGTGDVCTTCGQPRKDGHIHTSHLSRVPAKTATCTQEGNVGYYTCDCGKWFTDVTATVEITDHSSVVTPAVGHVDKDKNGRCDICKERLNVETQSYLMTEGADSTWINTSEQGMVFRASSDFSKFDRVEVDGATVSSLNYTVSSGSTIVELNANYLKRLTIGQHKIAIVAADGRAEAAFSVKQGSASSGKDGGSGIWIFVAVVAVVALLAAIAIACYLMYTGNAPIFSKKKKGGKFTRQ